MIGRQVRIRQGNRTPAYDGLYGIITDMLDHETYPYSIRLEGYSWDVRFDRDEIELPNDPLPLPG